MTFTRSRLVGVALASAGVALTGLAFRRSRRLALLVVDLDARLREDPAMLPPDPIPGHPRYASASTHARIEGEPIPVALVYREDDPFAVTLRVDPEDPSKDWTFARSILTAALAYQDAGDVLDVGARRSGAGGQEFAITLAAAATPKTLLFQTAVVKDFLAMTHALVRIGQESEAIDWTVAETALGLAPGQLSDVA